VICHEYRLKARWVFAADYFIAYIFPLCFGRFFRGLKA
jgi:hypothetical protein